MRPELNLGDIQVLHDPFSTHVTLLQTITLFKISYRHLIRCKSMGEYQEELSNMITRWSRPFVDYWMSKIHRDIDKFAAWSMEKMNFPMTENSVLTSNQCEAMNRINKEQQDWQEMAVDKAFLIGRDIQKAKVYDMARGMMGLGNFELLPEFRSKFTPEMGEDLLRRLGSTPSFENIVSRHKETRNLSRHAGSGRPVLDVVNEELEDDSTEVAFNIDEVEMNETSFESVVVAAPLNDSKELQEIGEEFDLDESFERPEEELSETQINPVNSVAPVNVQSTPIATPTESHRNVARFVTPTNPPSTPAATPAGCDEITYIPSLDAYFSPGSNFPTSVQLKKNLCSQCGYCPPRNWCQHLRNAGIKAGINVKSKTPILKSLTMLEKTENRHNKKR